MLTKIATDIFSFSKAILLKCNNQKAEGYVDSGMKIVIAVVIGALLLSFLYWLIGDLIVPIQTSQINHLFSYSG